jgi:serine/threonine protein phosphatase 1
LIVFKNNFSVYYFNHFSIFVQCRRPFLIDLPVKISGPFIVIGDVHGQIDLLRDLLNNLKKDVRDLDKRWLVFIGDLVDRGKYSKHVIQLVMDLLQTRGKTACIMGNHEYVLISSLGMLGAERQREWTGMYKKIFSSGPTFCSYDVKEGDLQALKNAMPMKHQEFLFSLPWYIEAEGHLIVHAGLFPDKPFKPQLEELKIRDFSTMWIPYFDDPELVSSDPPSDCPLTVISGHVRQKAVIFREKRILVDTTGGLGGKLSAVLLPERKVITSGQSSS